MKDDSAIYEQWASSGRRGRTPTQRAHKKVNKNHHTIANKTLTRKSIIIFCVQLNPFRRRQSYFSASLFSRSLMRLIVVVVVVATATAGTIGNGDDDGSGGGGGGSSGSGGGGGDGIDGGGGVGDGGVFCYHCYCICTAQVAGIFIPYWLFSALVPCLAVYSVLLYLLRFAISFSALFFVPLALLRSHIRFGICAFFFHGSGERIP